MSDNDDRLANRIVGNVLGSSVANVVHGGVHINTTSPVDHTPEIESLLRAQVQAAQDLPQRLPGTRRPALADVYVRQDLGTGVDTSQSEPPQPTPILDGHGQLVEVPGPPPTRIAIRPPVRTVRQALDEADHLVVTGGAGQGKSTLSLRLAADAAAHWLDNGDAALTESLIPLRLTARALAARLHMPFADALADSVRADYGSLLRVPVSAAVLSERVQYCRWLLLVDGLDEVADGDDRDRLAKVLASCAAESTYRVVLTTRPIEGMVLAPLQRIGAVRYELQPFDEEALRQFAENWFAADGCELAERFLRQIRAAHLDDLVRVPLLATIAAIVFQTHVDLPLPDNEYELYEAYTSYLRSIRPADHTFEPFRVPLLEHLGVVRVESDTSLVTAARDWISRHAAPNDLPFGWPERLTEFLVAAGPLVRRGDDMTFLHHSFAEHLAATDSARRLPEVFAADHDDFVRLLYAAYPKESGRYARSVALHYTRLHPDQADPLLQSLHARGADQHLLVARLLAKRMPATEPAVDAFLATVRGWAATTHYLADDIIAHACRATQHPGLADWLADLMRDERLPMASRAAAAAALAVRVRGIHQQEALRFLRFLVDYSQASIETRLTAAEALSDSGASERQAAERGLRSVLADDAGTGEDYRAAAVILAAFGEEARNFAVATLMRWLDDRNTAPLIVVEAATGLVEIGTEFHLRAAEAYRLILHDRMHNVAGHGDAALGLAALGPEFLIEAAEALTAVVHDRCRARVYRLIAAEVLARLGPQYRQTAGESVQAMLLEPGIHAVETTDCAVKLAKFGPKFRECVELRLRALIANHSMPVAYVISAIDGLRECGVIREPELASQLWGLLDEIDSAGESVTVLGRLTGLGEPHRTSAVERLRAHLCDGSVPTPTRCRAASALIDAGPEFHVEVTGSLLAIAEAGFDVGATFEAWRLLAKLGPQFHDRALQALLRIIRAGAETVTLFFQVQEFATSQTDRDLIADAMVAVLRDENRSFHKRESALIGLVGLGPAFHTDAVRELCAMLRSARTMEFDFPYVATQVPNVGIGLREEIARTLFTLSRAPEAGTVRIRSIMKALEFFGFSDTAEAKTALRTVIEHADVANNRLQGQGILIAIDSAAVSEVAAEVLSPFGTFDRFAWPWLIGRFAALDVAIEASLHILLSHPDVTASMRRASAMHLLTAFPTHRAEAKAEIERQLASDYRPPRRTVDTVTEYATVGVITWGRAVEHLAELVRDESLEIYDRCASASNYAAIDRSAAPRLFAFVRRLADTPDLTAAERVEAADWACALSHQCAIAVPHSLAASATLARGAASSRRALIRRLRRDLRTRVERTLLVDRSLPIRERLPEADVWDDIPLWTEVVAEIREVMTELEFPPSERVDAAAALARLDIRANAEATALLDGMPTEASISWRAKEALIRLGTQRGREVRHAVERTALDEALPLRVRRTAVELLVSTSPRTPPPLVGVLRDIAAAPGVSARKRAKALFALGPYDGLAALRAMRDDEQTAAPVRWYAAVELSDYRPEDSAAAARLFAAIAEDPQIPAALRWRAAKDLAQRGQTGRKRAIELLREITADIGLPAGARANAASVLGEVSPNRRGEVLEVLYALLATEKPLLRRKVLLEIGQCRQEETALELLAMADDVRHGPVIRMRCAEGAVSLWLDCRDRAAVVVREVTNDEAVPWHVRRRAACHLARWSAVCREEARELIRELDRSAKPRHASRT